MFYQSSIGQLIILRALPTDETVWKSFLWILSSGPPYQIVMTLDLFRFFRSSILPIMYLRRMPHVLSIAWLALLICVWTTADLVVDLVFEEQEVTANPHETGEDPDGVAEHLLMQSERAAVVAQNTGTAPQPPDLHGFFVAVPVLGLTAPRAHPPPHPPPRDRLVSFSIPLRI